MKKKISFGIESTAHTFGVGIVNSDGKILANIKDSFISEKGGIIPFMAAQHHINVCDLVIEKAIESSKIKLNNINIISFANGPGIGQCLRIGSFAARLLSQKLNLPLIPVNHAIAHLEIGKMKTNAKNPVFLYISGVNTQVISYESGRYRILGETLDQGAGNFLDSFARFLGLGFPGGPKIYELSLKSKNFIDLPYTVKGMDVTFGGLLTNLKQKYLSGKYSKEDLAFSVQENIFAMFTEIAERALAHTGKKELVLAGGVCCNKRLQEMCKIMCEERNSSFFVPENQYLVDNGAMIAWTGLLKYKKAKIEDTKIKPHQRIDDIKVDWIQKETFINESDIN